MKKSLLLLISICSLCLLGGCGGGSSTTTQQNAATHFSVTPATSTPTEGTAFNITVTALDASGQMVASYSGTVHFTSTDGRAVFPVNATLMNGTGTFSVTLNTAGSQTITATDTASLTGTSSSINVSASTAASPVPFVNQPLSPDVVVPGGAAFKLTVNGTGFVSGSAVKWNGSARTTSFVSDSQLTADILASDIVNPNTALVTVVNPAPGGGTSNVDFFETARPTLSVSWSITSALTTGTGPSSVATEDFNGDGKLDLVVTNGGSNNISIFLGNGDGTFQAAVKYPAGTNPDSVAVGDFNGDGKLDLVVSNGGSNNISILLGRGDGTFQAAVNYPTGSNPDSVAVGDFIGEGKLDVAVANSGSSNVSILLGNGDGTFQTAVDYGAGSNPSSVALGDFDGDGKLDMVVANGGSGNVSILLGNGDGTFQTAVDYGAGSNPSSVVVGDLNGDGRLDLAVADPGIGFVAILVGNGNGTFQAFAPFPAETNCASVAVGDFNGDGKLDLAVTNGTSVGLLMGDGDGTFQRAVNYAAGSSPSSLAVGDFNGDGKLDLAVADLTNSMVSVLLHPLVSGPNATVSPTILTFATQVVGTTSFSQSVLLSNNGTATLNITGIAATTNFGESDNCGSSLAAGAGCTISVTFTPTALDNLAGSLTITDNAPGSPQTVSLNGVGTVVDLSPSRLNFTCTIPGCSSQKVTLTNTGATSLSITSITTSSPIVGTHHAFSETNDCPTSLAAGQFCTITVTFNGVFDTFYNGTLNVTDNGGGSPQTVFLSGIVQ